MRVKRLDTSEAEAISTQISEHANKLRTTQDELRTLLDEIARNRAELRQGQISRKAYDEIIKKMRQDEERLRHRIRGTVSQKLQLLSQAETLLKSHRIEPKTKKKKARRKARKTRAVKRKAGRTARRRRR